MTALGTRTSPQEITEFYGTFLEAYRGAPSIHPDLAEQAALEDISYALRRLPIPSEIRNVWLMTLPPQASELYEATKEAEQLISLEHRRKSFDKVNQALNGTRLFVKRIRFKFGLTLLGVK